MKLTARPENRYPLARLRTRFSKCSIRGNSSTEHWSGCCRIEGFRDVRHVRSRTDRVLLKGAWCEIAADFLIDAGAIVSRETGC